MKSLIKKLLREGLEPESNAELKAFYDEVNLNHNNFLLNSFKNPNFELRLTKDGGVKSSPYIYGKSNKCETNVFEFIKEKMWNKIYHYYPVSGWAFLESTTFFEHFWVYDAINDLFLEITPLNGQPPYAYGGVINKHINKDIYNAKHFYDIEFLKGKAGHSLYHNFQDQESTPKLGKHIASVDSIDTRTFNFIKNSPEYTELAKFLNNEFPHIDSVKELEQLKYKLDNKLDTVKSSREWDYFDDLINDIKGILYNYKKSSK